MSQSASMRVQLRLAALVATAAFLTPPAAAQSADALRELAQQYERVTSGKPLSMDEGYELLDKLYEWDLSASELSPAQRTQLLIVEVYANLATGNASQARTRLGEVTGPAADSPQAAAAALDVALASGDAPAAAKALDKLAAVADGRQKESLAAVRKGLERIGKPAPQTELKAGDKTIRPHFRSGLVLLVDFWNTSDTDADAAAALARLQKDFADELYLELVGVNTDARADLEKAEALAKERGFVWPIVYEQRSKGALLQRAFDAGKPPWQMLIDRDGHIRAVGHVTQPGFAYAVYAAVAEARGNFTPQIPIALDGKPARRPPADDAGPRVAKPGDKPAATADLPSNPEALAKLRQAHALRRGGSRTAAKKLYEEIVRDFPGTKEAAEAQEYLDMMP